MNILPSGYRRRNRLHSFTLIELLTVLAIGSILAVLSMSAYARIMRSQTIAIGAQMLAGALDLARQNAITHNCRVEFRLYELPDYNALVTAAPTVYRGYQTFLVTSNATNALSQVTFLPKPTVISSVSTTTSSVMPPNLTLLPGNGVNFPQGTLGAAPVVYTTLPVYGNNYKALVFDFAPSGGLELSTASTWYMTLILENDAIVANNLPKNYATIQVDPFSGRVKTFRP